MQPKAIRLILNPEVPSRVYSIMVSLDVCLLRPQCKETRFRGERDRSGSCRKRLGQAEGLPLGLLPSSRA